MGYSDGAGVPGGAVPGALEAGCANPVRPSEVEGDPVAVALIDPGHHSSLVLPDPDGGSTVYFAPSNCRS
jgi:hypothetical protein